MFKAVVPKEIEEALSSSAGTLGRSCKSNTAKLPVTEAVKVTDCAELTGEALALKLTEVAPAGKVSVAGSFTAPLLLERLTLIPPLGVDVFSLSEHGSVPAPTIDLCPQVNTLRPGVPLPLSAIDVSGWEDGVVSITS